ncbi:MAG: SH3-like domain-containing protein [Pseudomonadota bacterium]
MSRTASTPAQRFNIGDRVRIDSRPSAGHCRAPSYLRGQEGTVTAIHGRFRNPEQLAYMKPGLPEVTLYKVRLQQTHIWQGYGGFSGDEIEVDIYEHWLLPAGHA